MSQHQCHFKIKIYPLSHTHKIGILKNRAFESQIRRENKISPAFHILNFFLLHILFFYLLMRGKTFSLIMIFDAIQILSFKQAGCFY